MSSQPCATRGRKQSLDQPPFRPPPLGGAAPRGPRAGGLQRRPSRNRPKLGKQARVATLIPARRARPGDSHPARCFLGGRNDGGDAHLCGQTTAARGGTRASGVRAGGPQSRRAVSLLADAQESRQSTPPLFMTIMSSGKNDSPTCDARAAAIVTAAGGSPEQNGAAGVSRQLSRASRGPIQEFAQSGTPPYLRIYGPQPSRRGRPYH